MNRLPDAPRPSPFAMHLLPVLAGVLPLALYVATACRDIFWMDSTEFMLAGRALALSHPPGYPLLTLITRLFSLGAGHPFLALPFRLNLIAALAAAGSCVMVYFIVAELTYGKRGTVPQSAGVELDAGQSPFSARAAALFAALLWGSSFELWQQATALEVYSFQAFLLSVALLAMVKWSSSVFCGLEDRGQIHGENLGTVPGSRTRPCEGTVPRFPGSRWLLLAFFAFGLALANHTPVMLWVPSVLLLLLSPSARIGPRLLGLGLVLTALAVCLYAYVPLRASSVEGQYWGGISSFADLVQYLTGRVYRYRVLAGGTQYLGTQLSGLPSLFGRQFLAAWVLLVPGAVVLWRGNRRLLVALLLGAAVVTGAALAYNIPDKEGYLLPVYLAMVVVIGCGFASLLRSRFRTVVLVLGLAMVALPVAVSYQTQNRSRLHGLSDLSATVLAGLPEDAALFTDDYSLFQGARWLQTSGKRRDVLVVSEHHLAFPWYLEQLRRTRAVPAQASSLTARLWHAPSRMSDAAFGETAKAATQDVKLALTQAWLPATRVFWFPRDFTDWVQEWRGLRLTMRGLCYELAAQDATLDLSYPLPAPDRYRTTLYRDPETQDLCRRFAAAVCRRGIARFAQDDNAGAISDFNLSLSYFPDYPSAVENKGIVFYFSGQPDSARHYLNRFTVLDPQSPELPKVRQLLARLQSR